MKNTKTIDLQPVLFTAGILLLIITALLILNDNNPWWYHAHSILIGLFAITTDGVIKIPSPKNKTDMNQAS